MMCSALLSASRRCRPAVVTPARWFAAGVLLLASSGPFAQSVVAPPQNVVQLSASATIEVQQDLLTLSMTTSRDGPDAALVQTQLKLALDAALGEARKFAQPGQLELRTGNFNLHPRYGRDGRISGWQGTAEMVLEGRDFARIGEAAGKIQTLSIGGVQFGLSRAQRAKIELEAQALAIERFKSKAADIARGFGFAAYTLREVSVHANDQGFAPRPRAMALESKMAGAQAPVPLEAGKTAVLVTVSGSVQLK